MLNQESLTGRVSLKGEPHKNIVRNRKSHIECYVAFSMFLNNYVVRKP